MIEEAGYGTSVKCDYNRSAGDVAVLRIPNVAGEVTSFNDMKYGRLSDAELARVTAHEGDLLVVRTNGSPDLVGRCAVVRDAKEPAAFASYLIRIRCKAGVDADYVQAMLRHLRVNGTLVDFARTTAGQYNVSLGRLRSARLPLPPLAEQRRVVGYLHALSGKSHFLTKLQDHRAAELDAVLPSILDRAFNGEL